MPPHRDALNFVKMHGLGNDFMVVVDQNLSRSSQERVSSLAQALCHRHLGVGADGLVLVKTSSHGAHLHIYNSDGSPARNCGNALLCVAQLLWNPRSEPETASTLSPTPLRLTVEGGSESIATPRWVEGQLRPVVRMDPPDLAAASIPIQLPEGMKEPVLHQELNLGAEPLRISCVSMGNPHCVLFFNDLTDHLLGRLGPRLEVAPCFPDRTNVELVRVVNRSLLEVLVWERGVGPTLSCGTGACAAAVVSRLLDKTESTVEVKLPGGTFEVTWMGEGLPVFLAGRAEVVFRGTVVLPA